MIVLVEANCLCVNCIFHFYLLMNLITRPMDVDCTPKLMENTVLYAIQTSHSL